MMAIHWFTRILSVPVRFLISLSSGKTIPHSLGSPNAILIVNLIICDANHFGSGIQSIELTHHMQL